MCITESVRTPRVTDLIIEKKRGRLRQKKNEGV